MSGGGTRAPFAVAVMAAQRDGRLDPLAAEAGVSHKCLVPIGGAPLLEHVLRALAGAEGIARVRIAVEPQAVEALSAVPGARGEFGVPVAFVPAAANLADSVHACAAGVEEPLVITTADNVLLTADAVTAAADRLIAGADAVVVLTTREAVLAAHPDGQRRFYRFADAHYSNCNLYGLAGPRGLRLAETFRSGGQFAKNPWRIVEAFGLLNLLLLHFGLISLGGAMRRLSRRFSARIEPLVLADGSHAIDVDNARTHAIAGLLMEERATGEPQAGH